jgi:hypothetical protein
MRGTDPSPATAEEVVSICVPFRLRKRGGRREIILPPADRDTARRTPDDTIVKALARAFRWKRLLDTGRFSTIAELAAHERIAPSYLTRVLRLTLLAPDIIEAILDGQQRGEVTLEALLNPPAASWTEQRQAMAMPAPQRAPAAQDGNAQSVSAR